MDWTLTGAVTGVVILAGTVGYGVFALTKPDPTPAKQVPSRIQLAPTASGGALSPIPDIMYPSGDVTLPPLPETDTYAMADAASRPAPAPAPRPAKGDAATPAAKKGAVAQRPGSDAFGSALPTPEQKKTTVASLPPAAAGKALAPAEAQAPERWRVATTGKASYFNLGGHVDKAGIVDGMASPHLRDALLKNKNFDKLPAPIKAHISGGSNLDLTKIAPYRMLLGMDDRQMEEQGVRFERLAGGRG
jgi:hypothetical protein